MRAAGQFNVEAFRRTPYHQVVFPIDRFPSGRVGTPPNIPRVAAAVHSLLTFEPVLPAVAVDWGKGALPRRAQFRGSRKTMQSNFKKIRFSLIKLGRRSLPISVVSAANGDPANKGTPTPPRTRLAQQPEESTSLRKEADFGCNHLTFGPPVALA